MTKIAELYGISTDIDPPGSDWATVVASQQCPYLGRKCLKNRKSEAGLTIGSCTLYFGQESDTIMICPFRLLERQQVFMDCIHLLTLHQPGNELHIVKEVDVPGGSIDYCLVSVRKNKVIDFAGIEFQTLDTTGTAWPERQRFLHDHKIPVLEEDRKSKSKVGVNWKMTAKTILVQLHHKIKTFENLSKHLVLVNQDHLMAYMRKEFSFGHLEAARPGDPMHFHSYALEKEETGFKLKLSERWSTDTAGIAKCLKMEAEANVELEIIIKQLESKISASTLMVMSPPEPPSSLAEEAKEGD
jgi:hypothetical protein